MYQIKLIKGNIFNSRNQTLINTINTVGVMGRGLALEFRLRYPEMFLKYKKFCENKQITVGKLWLYKTKNKWILNFPTKKHWINDSKIEYLKLGLEKFLSSYQKKGIKSAAFPLLGTQNGNISKSESLAIMLKYLKKCRIPIEIYEYDKKIQDDLYPKFVFLFSTMELKQLKETTNITIQNLKKLKSIMLNAKINNMSELIKCKGIGNKTLENLFYFLQNYEGN